MKAIVCTRYGGPDVLEFQHVPKPEPKDNEVLIKNYASTVTTSGAFMRRGEPRFARLFTGLRRPNVAIPGTDLAGIVEAIGKDVSKFSVGDRVFAATDTKMGAHAEYTCAAEDSAIAPMPANASFEEAAAICEGGLTALPFLRDSAHLKAGQRVLIIGASGAIGTFAVQLANHFGATVTGVCSSANVELVGSLGANRIIDYSREEVTQSNETFDVVFDTVGKSSFSKCKRILTDRGYYLSPVLTFGTLASMLWTSCFGKKKAVFSATGLRSAADKTQDMLFLKERFEAGELRSVIDRRYPLEQAAEANEYVDQGHKKGNVVLVISENSAS